MAECPPVAVEGDWSPNQSRTVKNKLQIYFQSKKRSSGGDCRVEAEDGAARAAVFFRSEEGELDRTGPRDKPENHLRTDSVKQAFVVPSDRRSAAVVLENVPDRMSRDLLSMLVENVSGLDDSSYSLEVILESSRAVVSFSSPKHKRTRHHLKSTQLTSVSLFPAAAVQNICIKEDCLIRSIPVKVYPFYQSLGTALYGEERPAWKLPESFTESVHPVVWKFLQMKKLFQSISDQMRPHFCSVDLDQPDVKLSPLPSFLRQAGLTANHVDGWQRSALDAFRRLMSQYSAFECQANGPAWKIAEKDVRSVLREDGVPVLDASRGVLTVAGRADDMKQIRASVENIVLKAMSVIERQTNGVSEVMPLSPAMFYILKQEGLNRAAQDISPDMNLSYDDATQQLTIAGLPAEVFETKAWILERNMNMCKKQLNIHPCLLNFLGTVDHTDMSQDLFTSQGISAIYTVDNKGLFLLGSSDRILADAESKMKAVLAQQILDVEDQEVMQLSGWMDLKQQLLDTYSSSKKKTVAIQTNSDKVMVAGFVSPVREVSRSLKEFITNYSRVQEAVRVESCAVVQFINKKKTQDWSSISRDNNVAVRFDPERPRIILAGARLHVQKARSYFQELASALCTDTLTVDKPGAKKYFQSSGGWFLSTIMTEFSCVVVLRPEVQDEDEEENYEGENNVCYCKVKTTGRVLVSVSKADICSFSVDAVVNAANEDLKHIGGLALALLQAAGPELQKTSDDYVAKNGPLRPGDAMVTGAYNLSCKHIVHAVGPRFSDFDRKTSVSRLKTAVKESLRQAEAVNCSSVALPAISSGVFGFPVQLCAETIAQAVREYCDSPQGPRSLTEVHLVDNKEDTVRVMAAAVNTEFIDLEPTMTVPPPAAGRGLQTWLTSSVRPHFVFQTDVIVNTISENKNLKQGAVSKAILEAAGQRLQVAVLSEASAATLQHGDVVVTDGFGLMCRKVFHTVCPPWDNRGGLAEEELVSIVRFCLDEAEKLRMASLSFPAVGTGNLGFPRDVVSRVLLGEIRLFSRTRTPQHLKEVAVVVHPSDKGSRRATCWSTSISPVLSPSLGVYRMQVGQLTLEVSSGDITKEASDVIVNSSNQDFTLKAGVSKAILDGAGQSVELECLQIGENELDCVIVPPVFITVIIITRPGQGGVSPSAVANAMVDAVVDFVRKKQPRFVRSVKILIFQTAMTAEFHRSMKRRQGEEVEEKSVFTRIKGIRRRSHGLKLLPLWVQSRGQLCTVTFIHPHLAKKRITDLTVSEQAERTISDPFIGLLSPADVEKLKALQKQLTVSIRLDRRPEDQEPHIHLEGLTRDVHTAESAVRWNLKSKALLVSGLVEWQFQHRSGPMVPFDMNTNLKLEEALERKQTVKVQINNQTFTANPAKRQASSGSKVVELLRREVKVDHNKENSQSFTDVERVQNTTLFQSYQLMKKQLEVKNKHKKNERLLFHGTGSTSIDLINKQGFNRSYAGAHGAMYGNGSYFAVNPTYSAQGYAKPDVRGYKRMYQARVLVGDFTQGRAGLLSPPAKSSGNATDLYDSVSDNTAKPTMFVIFNDIQAYPEYLVTFT
uniref:Poly [ADP-ribose] polymerase n=1 Tax=Stegastes partitus TaxID=144197 RepID=A0A3B5B177_9TELE